MLYQAEPLPVIGAPERSRTPNLLIRSQTLYPIELRALIHDVFRRCNLATQLSYHTTFSNASTFKIF